MRECFFVVIGTTAFAASSALAQGMQSFPLESRRCQDLPEHAAVQDCLQRGKAEARAWEKHIKERFGKPAVNLKATEPPLPMNCFKHAATGETVCSN